MAQFLLFAGETCYPAGGWDDFRGAFDDVESAKAEGWRLVAARDPFVTWWHVVSLATLTVVLEYSTGGEYVPPPEPDHLVSSPDKLNDDKSQQ